MQNLTQKYLVKNNFFQGIFTTKGYLLTNFIDVSKRYFFAFETSLYDRLENKYEIHQELLAYANEQEMINKHISTNFTTLNLKYQCFDLFDTIFIEFHFNIFDWFSTAFFSYFRDSCHLIILFPIDIEEVILNKTINICEGIVKNTAISTIQLHFNKEIDTSFLAEIALDGRLIIVTNTNYPLLKAELEFYKESQVRHTFFNKNIFIDSKGNIKNAPECEEIFGNINDVKNIDDLKKIIATPEFQKYWFVHKELCDVCKDCEFRHMCIDNRLPSQRTDGSWYHKTECNYNPYICKWKGEEGYQTLEECRVTSNENGFNIDNEAVGKINQYLWM